MQDRITAMLTLLGGLGGSLVALSIIKPKSRTDALLRILSSIIISYFLTDPTCSIVETKFDIILTPKSQAAVAMLIGLFGWFLISIALHTVASSKTIKDLKEKIK